MFRKSKRPFIRISMVTAWAKKSCAVRAWATTLPVRGSNLSGSRGEIFGIHGEEQEGLSSLEVSNNLTCFRGTRLRSLVGNT
jgi:hypothetical protein